MPKPLDIDRAAWVLIRCHGDDCAKVAYQRARSCRHRGDDAGAQAWKLVVEKVVELHFSTPRGRLN